MGFRTISILLLLSLIISTVLGDLPSCSRAKCHHCETGLIADLCPTTCSSCKSQTSRVVAHGQPNIAGVHSELKALPQAPVSAQPLPSAVPQQPQIKTPQISQPSAQNVVRPSYQPNPFYPQQQNIGYQPFQQQNFFQPQQPFQFPQSGFGQSSNPFFNPFQPFLQQTFQAQNPLNAFTLPTFAPVTFQPVTPPPIPTPPPPQLPQFPQQPQQPQPQYPHAPTNGGFTQPPQQPYQPQPQQPQQVQTPQQPQQRVQTQQSIQEKPKQIYNTQQPPRVQPQQPQRGYYQQGPQPQPQQVTPASVVPQQPVYPSAPTPNQQPQPQPLPSAPAPPPAVQTQQCPKNNWEPCISKELANDRFRNCCARLGEGCAQICSYDQSLATVQVAVLTGRCPVSKVADMLVCASGYEDATPCCQAYNVFEPGFEHCRPYCNPSAGLPNDGMLAEKFRCLGKMSQIQRCFYVTQRP